MKKILFALLATVAISPAMAQTYNSNGYRTTPRPQPVYRTTRPTQQQTRQMREPAVYRTNEPVQYQTYQTNQQPTYKKAETSSKYALGNPLYRPAAKEFVVSGVASYERDPKNKKLMQESESTWQVRPEISFGITDKLSLKGLLVYSRNEIKSGIDKGSKISLYGSKVDIDYQLASFDGIDLNTGIGAYYLHSIDKNLVVYPKKSGYESGFDLNVQFGKKIDRFTPSLKLGFISSFYSKIDYGSGTNTYINPSLYIDLNKYLGLDLDYINIIHGDAKYRVLFDFYPQDNMMFRLGLFTIHPESDANSYGASAGFKFGF